VVTYSQTVSYSAIADHLMSNQNYYFHNKHKKQFPKFIPLLSEAKLLTYKNRSKNFTSQKFRFTFKAKSLTRSEILLDTCIPAVWSSPVCTQRWENLLLHYAWLISGRVSVLTVFF